MALLHELSVGTRVRVHASQFQRPQDGVIVAINDPEKKPGKQIAIKLDNHIPFAHGLEAKLKSGKPYRYGEDQFDEQGVQWAAADDFVTEVPKGRGWYATPEEIEVL